MCVREKKGGVRHKGSLVVHFVASLHACMHEKSLRPAMLAMHRGPTAGLVCGLNKIKTAFCAPMVWIRPC